MPNMQMETVIYKMRWLVAYVKLDKWELTTIQVYYYIPDYEHIVNLFMFQDDDVPPKYPRMQRFVKYWEENLIAKIESIKISSANQSDVKRVDKYFHIN